MISPLFLEIEAALKNGQPFEIKNDQTLLKFEKMNFIARILYDSADPEITSSRFIKNAVSLSFILKNTQRCIWNDSCKIAKIAASVKLFLKNNQDFENTPSYKKCALELLALRLGIEADVLMNKRNLGFIAFAKENHLFNSLMTFNHHLEIDPLTLEILILCNNVRTPWSTARAFIEESKKEDSSDPAILGPYALSLYGCKGIQYKNRYKWTKLEPLLHGDTSTWASHFIKDPLIFDENHRGYVLEFCSSATEKAPQILSGDHDWIRIYKFIMSNGNIIGKMCSKGLYRPHKHHFYFDNLWFPFCVKKGYLADDISEEWGINHKIKTVALRINQEKYKNIKRKIHQDKASNNIIYHLFSNNCGHYVNSVARVANVDLPTKRHFILLFTCIHLRNSWNKQLATRSHSIQISAIAAQKIMMAFLYALTPFFNLLFYLVGSGLVSKNVLFDPAIKPPLNSLFDFFRPQKLITDSPWVLANFVKEEVESWRQSEIDKLDLDSLNGLARQDEIALQFPPSYSIL